MRQMMFLEASDLERMKAGNPIVLNFNGSEILLGMQETKRPRYEPIALPDQPRTYERKRKKYEPGHSMTHTPAPRPPKPGKLPLYPCKICNFVSTRPQGLKSHERSHAFQARKQQLKQEGKAS